MNQIKTLVKKELLSYFASPISYIFIIIFNISIMGFTFALGKFYESNNASLEIFFNFHPWVYLFLIPAIGMRLWSEEKSEGTIEILRTLPFTFNQLIWGKFLGAWIFILICLILTLPIVITVFYLGSPDIGSIFTGYFGSWLMAGSFLSITALTSSLTKNQVISFALSVLLCLAFILVGFGVFQSYLNFLPTEVSEFIANFGFMPHFQRLTRGVIRFNDLIYFVSISTFFLILNAFSLEKLSSK